MPRPIEERAKTTGAIERRAYPVALQVQRAAESTSGPATVEGYASVTEAPYDMFDWYGPYSEVVRGGAFGKTLGENPQVQLLLNHGGLSMAYTRAGTLQLSEDSTGLHMRADVNPARGDVADMLLALEDGAVDEMSFAFRVTRQLWSPDYDQRDILEVDLHRGDVSVVNFGANPDTSVGATRSARATLRGQVLALAGRAQTLALTPDDTQALSALLVQVAAADAALDPFVDALCRSGAALDLTQPTLAGMLGLSARDAVEVPSDAGMPAALAAARLAMARARVA